MNISKIFLNKQKFACNVIKNLLKKNNITEYKCYKQPLMISYIINTNWYNITIQVSKNKIYVRLVNLRITSKAEILINKTPNIIKDSIEFYLDDDLKKFGLIKEILEKY